MQLIETPIKGVFEAASQPHDDDRGLFARLFCRETLAAAHNERPIVQVNFSRTQSLGAIRGMHFQHPPKTEAKWIRCIRGHVFDVVIDLRYGSPTFFSWHAVELNAQRMNAVFIPEGCAHGFQVLEAGSELLYLHSESYAPESEGGVRHDDPRIGISWPLPATDLSERDRSHALITETFQGIKL